MSPWRVEAKAAGPTPAVHAWARLRTSRMTLAITLLSIASQALLFVPLAMLRPVDGDEGYYSYASILVMKGWVPYRDFLYQQLPLLPYVYGAWMTLFGPSCTGTRGVSCLRSSRSRSAHSSFCTRGDDSGHLRRSRDSPSTCGPRPA